MRAGAIRQEFAPRDPALYRRTVPRVSPKTRRWLGRVGLAVALAVGLAYLPYRLLDGTGVSDAPRLRDELADTKKEINRLRRENARHRRQIEALKSDPAAIEDIARDEIGLVHKDEIVIRVEERP
jgi:cell division protein FtsB